MFIIFYKKKPEENKKSCVKGNLYNTLYLFLIGLTTAKGSSWHIVLFMLTSRMLRKREKWIKKGLPWSTLKIRSSDLVKIMAYIRHTRTVERHNNVLNVTLNHVQRTTFMLFSNWINISYGVTKNITEGWCFQTDIGLSLYYEFVWKSYSIYIDFHDWRL